MLILNSAAVIHYFTTRDRVDFLAALEVVVVCYILLQDRAARLIGSHRLLIAYPYIASRVACPSHPENYAVDFQRTTAWRRL